jgi:hypothetical protein
MSTRAVSGKASDTAAAATPAPALQLLLSLDTAVTCPACARSFSLEQGFAKQALEQLERSSQGALAALEHQVSAQVEQRAAALAAQRQSSAQQQIAQLQELLQQQRDEHAKSVREVRSLTEQAFAPQLAALRGELAHQQEQVSRLSAQELELRRAKGELEARASQLELEVVRRLDAARLEVENKVRSQEQQRAELEKAELQKKLDDVKAKLLEAQQKGSQGSQQLQGEILELALEEQLRQAFPVDSFEEVKKGARGADIVQRVVTRSLQVAGTILWEAKRAKEWGRDWTVKLKEDMRAAGADIGILVTTTLPRELPPSHLFGVYEEVWVSTWSAAIPLASALRERVLEVHKHRAISFGKGEKMEALYAYLTSAQFAQKLKAVYAAFQGMQDDLNKERSAAEQRWARREKQILTGMRELLGFAGDVQGLAQQDLPQLEMEKGPLL